MEQATKVKSIDNFYTTEEIPSSENMKILSKKRKEE